MKWKYITEQGDTWDTLAFDFYGSEKLMHILIEANSQYADIVIFSPGIELIIPETPLSAQSTNLVKAPWDD
ncbi:tail protein X [Orbus mooreae]|uniref:tail protein X n=1 Tax=Orbus mooreae TaxID=3074107 RepID=UPI00370D5134